MYAREKKAKDTIAKKENKMRLTESRKNTNLSLREDVAVMPIVRRVEIHSHVIEMSSACFHFHEPSGIEQLLDARTIRREEGVGDLYFLVRVFCLCGKVIELS